MMKLPPKKAVRTYELTFVIPGDRTSVQVSAVDAAVKALADKHKVKVMREEDWGKKEMAYKILHSGKKQSEGYYHHFIVEANASKIQAFEKDILLNDEIMRHLLVVAEDDQAEAAAETEQTDKTEK